MQFTCLYELQPLEASLNPAEILWNAAACYCQCMSFTICKKTEWEYYSIRAKRLMQNIIENQDRAYFLRMSFLTFCLFFHDQAYVFHLHDCEMKVICWMLVDVLAQRMKPLLYLWHYFMSLFRLDCFNVLWLTSSNFPRDI